LEAKSQSMKQACQINVYIHMETVHLDTKPSKCIYTYGNDTFRYEAKSLSMKKAHYEEKEVLGDEVTHKQHI